MNMIQGMIFDVDGTLLDSNDAHARTWKQVFDRFGFESSYVHIRSLIGMGGDKLLPRAVGVEKNSEIGTKLSKARSELFRLNYLPHLKPFPKARELIFKLKELGMSLSVASSAEKFELGSLLDLIGVRKLFNFQVSSDDVVHSKPDPDLIRVALKKLALRPDQVLFVGDTPYDIEAAARAHVKTIALRSGGRTDSDLKSAERIFDNPADLLQNIDAVIGNKTGARSAVR